MATIEQYSFDHILTREKWEELNDEIIEIAVREENRIKINELFRDNLESDFHNFLSETGIKEDKCDVVVKTYRKQSREIKRKYRTYRALLDNCLYDDYSESQDQLGSTQYKLLDYWEEIEKTYDQGILAHFYYMSGTYQHIIDMLPMYRQHKKNIEQSNKRYNTKKKPLNWFQWFFDQKYQDSLYK